MLATIASWTLRRRIVIGVVGALIIVGIVLASVGSSGRGRTPVAAPVGSPTSATVPSRSADRSPTSEITLATSPAVPVPVPELPRTQDYERYARAVAEALFSADPSRLTRDQFLQFWRRELATVVYSDAADKGLTLAGQSADTLGNLTQHWMPNEDAWTLAAAQHVRHDFVITSVSIPDYWTQAVADGLFKDPGLRIQRVLGVLTDYDRAGRATSARSVAIDLALLCAPTQPDGCRLLPPQPPSGS